jgi:hypothetical protein
MADKHAFGGRHYRTKGKPQTGRKPHDDNDAPLARGVLFAAQVEGRDLRRVLQSAAAKLVANGKIKLPRNAVQRVKAAVARIDGSVTEEQRAQFEQRLLMDTRAAARYVKSASNKRTAMRNVAAFALASWVTLCDAAFAVVAEQDPELRAALAAWARDAADAWIAREIVAIPS